MRRLLWNLPYTELFRQGKSSWHTQKNAKGQSRRKVRSFQLLSTNCRMFPRNCCNFSTICCKFPKLLEAVKPPEWWIVCGWKCSKASFFFVVLRVLNVMGWNKESRFTLKQCLNWNSKISCQKWVNVVFLKSKHQKYDPVNFNAMK